MKNKRTTVYEDREEKRRKYYEEHMMLCPYCGAEVLDHMTECPRCKKELTPKGYKPLTDKQIKKIKLITFSVGMVIAITVLVLWYVFWK